MGACAACGSPWEVVRSGDPYLIHGLLVCEECGETARRRMPWQFAALVGAVATATGFILMVEGVVPMALFPAATTLAMTAGAVSWMKYANRAAQRRIALDEAPEFGALARGS